MPIKSGKARKRTFIKVKPWPLSVHLHVVRVKWPLSVHLPVIKLEVEPGGRCAH